MPQNEVEISPEKEKAAFDAEVRLMEHMKAATKGSSTCGRAGCHNGVIWISTWHDKEGKPHLTLLTCKCAQVGKSEYALLNQRIGDLINHLGNIFAALEDGYTKKLAEATKELSNEISNHHEILSNQIDEIGLMHRIGKNLNERWSTLRSKHFTKVENAPSIFAKKELIQIMKDLSSETGKTI